VASERFDAEFLEGCTLYTSTEPWRCVQERSSGGTSGESCSR
jgi:hypothetical protein